MERPIYCYSSLLDSLGILVKGRHCLFAYIVSAILPVIVLPTKSVLYVKVVKLENLRGNLHFVHPSVLLTVRTFTYTTITFIISSS
jgi:hypothetical protein